MCLPLRVQIQSKTNPWFIIYHANIIGFIHTSVCVCVGVYLNPTMGHSLQMLHLAWCLAVSAAATLWRTGSHTMDWGSSLIQSTNCLGSSSTLLVTCGQEGEGGV